MAQGEERMRAHASTVAGFAACLAWQNAMSDFLYVPSAARSVSPLFVELVAAAVIAVWCYICYARDSSLLDPARAKAVFAGCAAAGAIAGVLVATGSLSDWAVYGAAAVMGYSGAVCLYLWAAVFYGMAGRDVLPSVFCALGVSAAAQWAFMHAGDAGSYAAAPTFALVSAACFAFAVRGRAHLGGSLLVRPRKTRSFVRIAFGLTLYALALGVTAGTTANAGAEASQAVINANVTAIAFAAAAVVVALHVLSRGRFSFLSAMQAFTPFVVLAMLLNVVAIEYADIWLAITLFAWQLLRLIAFGLLIEVARCGVVGLPLLFPAGWAVLHGGCALGVLAGQTLCPRFVEGEQGVIAVVVIVAVAVVVAAMAVFGSGAPAALLSRSGGSAEERSASGRLEGAGACAPVGEACASDDGAGVPVGEPGASTDGGGVSAAARTVFSGALTPCEDGGLPPDAADRAGASSDDAGPGDLGCGSIGKGDAAFQGEHAMGAAVQCAGGPGDRGDDSLAAACRALARTYRLSSREAEVLLLLVRGHTRASVAKRLFISENTVRAHAKGIYAKLGIHSKQQLIDMAESRMRSAR